MTATRWLLLAVLPVVAAAVVLSESAGYRAVALGALIVGTVGFWAEGRTRAAARQRTGNNNTGNNNTGNNNTGNGGGDGNGGNGGGDSGLGGQ